MNYTEAIKYLKRAEARGYIRYHSGIVCQENNNRKWGGPGNYYGINIDGDGKDGRLFGCPQIIWDAEQAEDMFPARKYAKK
jgi:hypothetical protein